MRPQDTVDYSRPLQRGPRDEYRFRKLEPKTRERLLFEADFFEGIVTRRPEYVDALQPLAHAYTELGHYHGGLDVDMRLTGIMPHDPVAIYNLACSQALTGMIEEALASLAKAWEMGYCDRQHILDDPDLASLHEDARFHEIIGG